MWLMNIPTNDFYRLSLCVGFVSNACEIIKHKTQVIDKASLWWLIFFWLLLYVVDEGNSVERECSWWSKKCACGAVLRRCTRVAIVCYCHLCVYCFASVLCSYVVFSLSCVEWWTVRVPVLTYWACFFLFISHWACLRYTYTGLEQAHCQSQLSLCTTSPFRIILLFLNWLFF